MPTVTAGPPVGTCHPGPWLLEEPTPTPMLVLLMEVTGSPRAGLDIARACTQTHTHARTCTHTHAHSSHFRLGSHTCWHGRAFLASGTSRAAPLLSPHPAPDNAWSAFRIHVSCHRLCSAFSVPPKLDLIPLFRPCVDSRYVFVCKHLTFLLELDVSGSVFTTLSLSQESRT